MNIVYKLPIIAILSITIATHVTSTPDHCSTDSLREHAVDACSHLLAHISKRQADLSDFGYVITTVKARHHHHRHPFAKKLTHSHFPKGGYLLIHFPLAHRIFASNHNQLTGSSSRSESISNDLSNDILSHDLMPAQDSTTHKRNDSIKNKYNMKFKRQTDADAIFIESCCSHLPQDTCGKVYCS